MGPSYIDSYDEIYGIIYKLSDNRIKEIAFWLARKKGIAKLKKMWDELVSALNGFEHQFGCILKENNSVTSISKTSDYFSDNLEKYLSEPDRKQMRSILEDKKPSKRFSELRSMISNIKIIGADSYYSWIFEEDERLYLSSSLSLIEDLSISLREQYTT